MQLKSIKLLCTKTRQKRIFLTIAHLLVFNKSPSDVYTKLDGSTYPRLKIGCLAIKNLDHSYGNTTVYFQDKCCYLQAYVAALDDKRLCQHPQVPGELWPRCPRGSRRAGTGQPLPAAFETSSSGRIPEPEERNS